MTERKTTMLMVDDDFVSCSLITSILKRDDCDILEAATASEALDGMGGADKTFVISTKHDYAANVEIVFKDNGAGMPASARDKIFEPFFTSEEAGKGTGLGLPIGLSIIKNHNSRTEVKSEVGAGTTFRIIFERNGKP
ncbi:MAG: ATP-binding protein [Syntrophales bacterium]|jgi:signal transduction histidine kinase